MKAKLILAAAIVGLPPTILLAYPIFATLAKLAERE